MMMQPQVQWTTPAPLWPGLTAANTQAVRAAFQQPAILRFDTDSFMDDFAALLGVNPPGIGKLWAQPETWRKPMGGPPVVEQVPTFALPMFKQRFFPFKRGERPRVAAIAAPQAPTTVAVRTQSDPLKLYQPAQQRFYLVTACLVCRLPGLPDRLLSSVEQESVSFVVRRLKPTQPGAVCADGTCTEFAYVIGPTGKHWEPVPDAQKATLRAGEDLNPLFPVSYDDGPRRRRLLAGLIPVARREQYMGAPMNAETNNQPPQAVDSRVTLLKTQALEPWQRLLDQVKDTKARLVAGETPATTSDQNKANTQRQKVEDDLRDGLLVASWYVLVDLVQFLKDYFPGTYAHIQNTNSTQTMTTPESEILTMLNSIQYVDSVDPGKNRSLASALTAIMAFTDNLENKISNPFNRDDYANKPTLWPSFPFYFAEPNNLNSIVFPSYLQPTLPNETSLDKLTAYIAARLSAPTTEPPQPLLAAQTLPDARDPGWFMIRCVFNRPLCGPINPPLVSQPTEVFQMAMFFDPDAPVRPVRITMPIDTTPAGLRKFAKNTAFVVSDVLACQINKAGKLTLGDLVLSVLPWPFHQDLPGGINEPCGSLDVGMICSLSIPIITIAAFILLIIIVLLFDLIFHWLPYLMICFPLPNFKAKKE